MKRRFLILTLVALLLPAALSPAARAAGGEDGRRASPFADVAPGDWYYEDVMALYELGLASGQRPLRRTSSCSGTASLPFGCFSSRAGWRTGNM